MLPELVETFQGFIDNWTKGVQELVDEVFGEENENDNEPILVSNTMYCDTLIRTAAYEIIPNTWNKYVSMVYKSEVKVFNNTITVNTTPLGRLAFSKTEWQNLGGNAGACETALNNQTIGTYTIVKAHDEDVFVRYATNDAYLSLYYGTPPSYHDYDVYRKIITDGNNEYKSDKCYVRFNAITYTIDNDGYVDVDTSNLDPYIDRMVAIKTHPVVMTCNDQPTITQYVTNSGSTNNYHRTYTTTGGDTVDMYYGDSYIIVNNNGYNTSYDDLKNMLDIAITQINDDNDTDITVPTYRENKYGPEPPPPPEPVTDDDYDDMGLGIPAEIATGLSHFAVLTKDELIQLVTDFNTNAAANQSISEHIIGLYRLGVASSELLTTASDNIVMLMKVGVADFTSNDNYNLVDKQKIVIDLGSIKVDREQLLTNTYYDYAPYTTYEMFIPCCGWVNLPDTIVDRTISVHLLFDLGTCSCKGIVRCGGSIDPPSNGTTIATINGIIGASVPFTINENGLQRGAVISGATQTVAGLAYTGVGAATDNIGLAISGATNALQGLANMYMAGNSSYTSVKGGASDYSIFGDGYEAVLKINRPVVDIPDNFAHTVGYVCNITDQLSNFSGFTVCLNPHVTGLTCTSTEKEEIAKLLEQGVILPAGEE